MNPADDDAFIYDASTCIEAVELCMQEIVVFAMSAGVSSVMTSMRLRAAEAERKRKRDAEEEDGYSDYVSDDPSEF